jgi:hypothetical protein
MESLRQRQTTFLTESGKTIQIFLYCLYRIVPDAANKTTFNDVLQEATEFVTKVQAMNLCGYQHVFTPDVIEFLRVWKENKDTLLNPSSRSSIHSVEMVFPPHDTPVESPSADFCDITGQVAADRFSLLRGPEEEIKYSYDPKTNTVVMHHSRTNSTFKVGWFEMAKVFENIDEPVGKLMLHPCAWKIPEQSMFPTRAEMHRINCAARAPECP